LYFHRSSTLKASAGLFQIFFAKPAFCAEWAYTLGALQRESTPGLFGVAGKNSKWFNTRSIDVYAKLLA